MRSKKKNKVKKNQNRRKMLLGVAAVVANSVVEEEMNGVALISTFFCVLRKAKDKLSILVVITPVFVILDFVEAIAFVVEVNLAFVIPTETFAGLTDVFLVIVAVIRVVYGLVGGIVVVMSLIFLFVTLNTRAMEGFIFEVNSVLQIEQLYPLQFDVHKQKYPFVSVM